jgi:hypothetical protein
MNLSLSRPQKTFADYLVIAISPVLIMLLTGSLCFFLVQVFYRGEMIGGVRWVLFWFVIAIVLVARIGIEQGENHALIYGGTLAAAVWFYLAQTHPAHLIGAALLATVWWSAHKLTRNCTLIDDDDDASGQGVLDAAIHPPSPEALPKPVAPKKSTKPKSTRPHRPGLWVVYFSIAALPLFGIGQTLLPDIAINRRVGFGYLFIYLAAAFGLLLTTSFLGLRRYLRQRYLPMPPNIAFGWVKFGVTIAAAVLTLSLLLPRPGADYTWKTLAYHIDYKLRQASEWAAKFNPPGTGHGTPGNQTGDDQQQPSTPKPGPHPEDTQKPAPNESLTQSDQPGQTPQTSIDLPMRTFAARIHLALRGVVIAIVAIAIFWWLIRTWKPLLQIIRAFIDAVRRFLKSLVEWKVNDRPAAPALVPTPLKNSSFAEFTNPFVTGKDRVWPPEQVVRYSYDALRAWAGEWGLEVRPEQTAREFCDAVRERFPEWESELTGLSFLYAYAAYGKTMPPDCDLTPVRRLWQQLTDAIAVAAP